MKKASYKGKGKMWKANTFKQSPVNPDNLFDNFIVGEKNKLAHKMALIITKRIELPPFLNPLIFHSPVGCGKTHLIQAIFNKIRYDDPLYKLCYIKSNDFTRFLVDSIRNNQKDIFFGFFENIEILILDDLQCFEEKPETLKAFMQIFDNFRSEKKQIVLGTSVFIEDMKGFDPEFILRLKQGTTALVEKPDFEIRLKILQMKAELFQNELLKVDIPQTVLELLAQNIESSVREMEGNLVTLISKSLFLNQELNLDLAKATLLKNS